MLTAPYVRELEVHCYRMLGSAQDAEDAVQDTLLSAWRGLDAFEERASLRTWLYRIATNRCLDIRRSASRRPATHWDVPDVDAMTPSSHGDVVWLEPFPDARFDAAVVVAGPAARIEQAEAISLAFITALQLLPARQVAVLILRDVLGFHSQEVADMLGATLDSVNSALKRARAGLQRQAPTVLADGPAVGSSPADEAVAARFVVAWESADVDALVDLLTDDVFISMPPIPYEYRGREVVAEFCAGIFGAGRRFDLVATRANRQPAYGAYLRSPTGVRHATGLYVLTVSGEQICAMTRFDAGALRRFGLPRWLPPLSRAEPDRPD